MSQAGKGGIYRPVDWKIWEDNYNRIFKNATPTQESSSSGAEKDRAQEEVASERIESKSCVVH
jgi:hypothetical protein